MLILSRKVGESIVIDGRITVKVVRLDGDIIKLGIDAPAEVPVHRQEVYEEILRNNREALTDGRPKLPRFQTAKSTRPAASSTPASETTPSPTPKAITPTTRQ